jgi:hypothetical protein
MTIAARIMYLQNAYSSSGATVPQHDVILLEGLAPTRHVIASSLTETSHGMRCVESTKQNANETAIEPHRVAKRRLRDPLIGAMHARQIGGPHLHR